MDFFLFTKSNWEEAPRLRHQVAELLASFGHRVMFFEKPSFTARALRPVAPGIVAVRTRSVIHHQLRVASWLSAANRSLEKREIRRVAAEGPAIGIVNFNYDYDFLRQLYPRARIVTIINDDFIDGARWFSRREASRVISATARISDQNLAVSYPLVEQVRRFSKDVKLFLPWARRRYLRPPHGLQRPDLLYWGYINDRIDAGAVLHVMDAGIRIHFVGPVTPSANMRKILAHPNSSLLPPSPLAQISEIVDRCCASILPYDIGFKQVAAITMNNRAFELLSAGLPLLYAALPGLIDAPQQVIYRCATSGAYVDAVHAARESFDASQPAIEEFLRGHSAAERYEQLMTYFSAAPEVREPSSREAGRGWRTAPGVGS
jgi:hypothetical protein